MAIDQTMSNETWLISKLSTSGNTPQARILSLFDLLGDGVKNQTLHLNLDAHKEDLLLFLTKEAKACGASNPAMLAEQIIYIAHSSLEKTLVDRDNKHLLHAKKVALALIQAQSQRSWLFSKPAVYGMAAILIIMTGATALWLTSELNQEGWLLKQALHERSPRTNLASQTPSDLLTARDASIMYAKYEQMRNGTCQFPEAIQIPDKDKAVYLENVVGGKLPTNLYDLSVANFYLEKVRCNYTPMLMLHSK